MSAPLNQNHIAASSNQLNKLRAAVLGANDGIVSVAGLVLGVTGAAASKETVLLAGIAGVVSGALSMAAGEFVSVSSQRDSERAFLLRTQKHIKEDHSSEIDELVEIYQNKGLSKSIAQLVAKEFYKNGTLTHELETELGLDPEDITNPWSASIASAIAFVIGSAIPLTAIALAPTELQVPATAGAVLVSLILTGTLSARAGQASKLRAALRVVVWGIGAMVITYAIGHLIGTSLG